MASSGIEDYEMVDTPVENHSTEQEPEIKLEQFSSWELPERVDLLSDDEDGQADIPLTPDAPSASAKRSVPSKENGLSENDAKAAKHAALLRMQRTLAEKYRNKNPDNSAAKRVPDRPKRRQNDPDEVLLERDDDMDVDDDQDAEEDGRQFQEAKKDYYRKKRANKLSIQDEIEFMRLETNETARLRKADADRAFDEARSSEEHDDDNNLFVRADSGAPKYTELYSDDNGDESDESPKKRRKARPDNSERPNKRGRAKVLGQDYTEDDVQDVIDNARGGKGKGKSKAKTKAQPKSKAQPKKAVPKKTRRGKGKEPDTQMTNLNNLFGQDVFTAHAATSHLPSQPTFGDTGRREEALKQLIAAVPEERTDVARADMRFLRAALKDFTGVGSVQPSANGDGNWLVKGMRTTLKHFQVLGTSFMRKREMGDRKPRGGILADEMGLGKTLMTLANIVNGQSNDKKLKTTLIVASPALVSQWYEEIRRHCYSRKENKHGIGNVMQYRAGHRLESNDILNVFENSDILLTTYTEVNASYPKAIIPPHLTTAQAKDEYWRDFYEREKGPLHAMKFLRIVLDEAQAIKNHRSLTSLACRALNGRFVWAITGTPIQNSIKEFYPYFKLLRVPHTGSYKVFKSNFATPNDPDGSEKLNVFLRQFMIRRTHLDTFAGAKLLDLPTPTQATMIVEFNDIERNIYEIVKKRFVERINTMSRRGTLEKSYGSIWAMVIRLRQMCAHILIISSTCLDLLEREDFELLNDLAQKEEDDDSDQASLLVHLKNVLRSEVGLQKEVIDASTGSTVLQQETTATGTANYQGHEESVGGSFGRTFRFQQYLDDFQHTDVYNAMGDRQACSGCRQKPRDPVITSCFHIYCRTCIKDLQHDAARRGRDQARCNECGAAYTSCVPLKDIPPPRESSSPGEEDGGYGSKAKKTDPSMDWINAPGPLLPSAKSRAVKAAILNYLEKDKQCKVIVYTQWRPFVKIMAKVCSAEGWGYCNYTGDMSHDSRNKAIHEFSTDPKKNILICGLKCGGLGLNLTAATKVVLVDPWWNQSVENQAFARCYRIGQEKETTLVKLIVKNSIDEAMVAVKERKQIEIDDVMNSGKMKQKLTVSDLMRLFGDVHEDSDGIPFIFADEAEDEHLRLANVDDEDEMGFMGNDE